MVKMLILYLYFMKLRKTAQWASLDPKHSSELKFINVLRWGRLLLGLGLDIIWEKKYS